MRNTPAVSFIYAAFLAGCLIAATATGRPLELDDMFKLRTVAEPQVSPDGRWVAYTLTAPDRERDEETSDIWMASWDGKETVRLTVSPETEHLPRWSPDGRFLAFLADRGEKDDAVDQIWLLDRRGGEAQQLTTHDGGVSDFAWSPDGKRLVFVAEVSPDEKGDDKPKPIVIDRFHFKQDITGYLGPERSHLFLVDISSRESVQLTDGDFNEVRPAWSPDGSMIAFATKRGKDPDRHENWDIYVMEPEPGATARQVTTNPGTDADPHGDWGAGPPRWSPDGKRIAYLHGGAPEDLWYGLVEIAVTSPGTPGEQRPTRSLDRNTLNAQWSADGKQLHFLLEDDQSVRLAQVRLRDGRIQRLTAPGRTVSDFHLSSTDKVALISSTPSGPAELYVLDGGELRPLTRHNEAWLRDVEVASTEAIEFESPDGLTLHGLLVKPAGYRAGTRYPTLLRIHGGPVGQYQHEFDFEWQLFAAHGYVVVGVNPRGSSGRGYAFQRSLFGEWGFVDLPDVLAAVDYLVEAGIADPDRLGVGGWSYGGILTNYVIASDARFKAAISGSGMSNMLGGYGIDQYVRDWELELGLPWENTAQWLRLSYPFLQANRITTPTLFMCGSLDFNVPLAASEQMYQALRRLGVPTQLVIYPDQYHSLDRVSFQHDKWRRYIEWYDKFVK